MNFISLLGLVVLLLLSWSLSYHRNQVKIRPIILGVGLQFVLAMILLKDNYLSFVGMGILGAVLVIYILRDALHIANPVANHAAHAVGALLVGAALYGLGTQGISPGGLALAAMALLVANRYLIRKPGLSTYCAAMIVVSGAAWLVLSGIHGRTIFENFSGLVVKFLGLTDFGAGFMFGFNWYKQTTNEFFPGFATQLAFSMLPTIIFFGGFMSVLYYLGVVQAVISVMAHFMRWSIGTSGAESLSCSANIFVGQTEAPLLVKPYLEGMTRSELLTVMVGGFATIAGGVLAAYVSFGINAGHLIAASVMAAPGALVVSKILYPEMEHSQTSGDVDLPSIPVGDNVIEAASNGISDGLKLALNVGAMLIGFIVLVAVVDMLLNWMDGLIDGQLLGGQLVAYKATGPSPAVQEYAGIFPGSLQTLFGTLFKPLAYLMGVPWKDAGLVGSLLGVKISLNEFVAYSSLSGYIRDSLLDARSQVIATYALCGFANFSSIGIQIGGLSALVPERRKDLAAVGLRAMIGGAIVSCCTACIAGFML